jgi:ubiquinone/menaquinone biosynthesis C-methylase UbiE
MKTAEELNTTWSDSQSIKSLVKKKYTEIALQSKETNECSCCGAGGCSSVDYTIMSDDYTQLEGYHPDADLGLGCGLPTEFSRIQPGDTVIDLGSGAGNDCFVARAIAGESGNVIGIDMTEAMIAKARINADNRGFNNVEFRLGDIEDLPVADNRADVVVSNCVLNLVPDKTKAFRETFRVLKPGGHFSISDVVMKGSLPEGLLKAGEMYAGCVAGAMQKEDYLNIIAEVGFINVEVQKQKQILLPDDIMLNFLSEEEVTRYKQSGTGIYSITVYGEKPDKNDPK